MIPQETIEQVREASDITQIIGDYVRLKKRGRNFIGLCPFHTEKTPSFTVTADKGIFYCFGCGKGGNVITFLMEHERMSFTEAVRFLAGKANIIIREDKGQSQHRESLDRLGYANQIAIDYFHSLLLMKKYNEVLQSYLHDKRKISKETVEEFSLGLAGDEWDGLIKYAGKKDLSPEDLVRAGLAIKSDSGKIFDRFRERLMIPIFNLSGKPIAFGGRTLKKGENIKYMNSPETPLYAKGHVLYGLNKSKDAIRESDSVLIVEGYFDLLSLWQNGVKNVVASSGTAFTAQQARLLARFANNVYLFFDADSAGQKAAMRSVDALYDAGLDVKVMLAPKGEDPDSVARTQGFAAIAKLMKDAISYIPYRLTEYNAGKTGIVEKEKLIKELAALGQQISDPTRRALFFAEAARTLEVDQALFSPVRNAQKANPSRVTLTVKKRSSEFELLSLLMHNPGLIDTIFESVSPDDFDSKSLSRLYSAMIQQYRTESRINAATLVGQFEDETMTSLTSQLAATEWEPDQIEVQTHKHLALMIEEKLKRIRSSLQKELTAASEAGDQQRADAILRQMEQFGLYAHKTKH
jgi:DNA primase